jgi:ABC-type Fe3+/spermidine/putrescine transport system ATPase subunit
MSGPRTPAVTRATTAAKASRPATDAAERPHVELLAVRKTFGDVVAVDDLNLTVRKGSFTTLLGPSGCGKTTTLRMLAGFYDPDDGDIVIGGRSQVGVPPNRRNVSIVFQDYALFPHMTVLQNVSYGLKFRRLAREERVRRVTRVLDFLGLSALAKRHPHELSGGQQQRVALGRSIVMEPDVLLMDEPLSNLDAKLRIRVRAELKEIQRATGITTIYVTHDQDEALSLSDLVAVMNHGRLQQYSTPWDLYHAPANRFVADFVGYANMLAATVASIGDGVATVRVDQAVGTGGLVCQDPVARAAPGTRVRVMVRPEWFRVLADDAAAPSDGIVLDGQVRSASFLGSFVRVWLTVPGVAEGVVLERDVDAEGELAEGTRLRLFVPDARAVVVDAG